MATQEAKRDLPGLLQELEKATRLVLSLPGQADRVFRQAAQGELVVRTSWTPDTTRTLHLVETAINRLAGAVIFAALLLAAVAIYVTQGAGTASFVLFALATVALLVSLTRR
jgi:hypothetical protein